MASGISADLSLKMALEDIFKDSRKTLFYNSSDKKWSAESQTLFSKLFNKSFKMSEPPVQFQATALALQHLSGKEKLLQEIAENYFFESVKVLEADDLSEDSGFQENLEGLIDSYEVIAVLKSPSKESILEIEHLINTYSGPASLDLIKEKLTLLSDVDPKTLAPCYNALQLFESTELLTKELKKLEKLDCPSKHPLSMKASFAVVQKISQSQSSSIPDLEDRLKILADIKVFLQEVKKYEGKRVKRLTEKLVLAQSLHEQTKYQLPFSLTRASQEGLALNLKEKALDLLSKNSDQINDLLSQIEALLERDSQKLSKLREA